MKRQGRALSKFEREKTKDKNGTGRELLLLPLSEAGATGLFLMYRTRTTVNDHIEADCPLRRAVAF